MSIALILGRWQQPKNKLHTPQNPAYPSHWDQKKRSSNETHNKGWNPEEKHRRWERWYWLSSAILSTFIAIGALVSLIFAWQAVNASHNAIQEAHEQTVQAHRQADAAEQSYVATIRAWMDVNVSQSPISFEWNKNMGPGITATVIGTNEGNSPALLASVSLLLVPEEFGLGPGELLRRDCVDIDFPPFGNLVLPKKEIERTGTTFVPWDRIKEAVYRSTAEEAAVSLGNPGDSDKIVFFYVFACATYRIIGDDRWHHTGKVYQLERFSISDQRVKSGFILGNEMPGTRFVVKREPDGDYAD